MTTLKQRQAQAQAAANRSKLPVAVYNFNPFNPYYVMRDYSEGDEKSRNFVSVHYPDESAFIDQSLRAYPYD